MKERKDVVINDSWSLTPDEVIHFNNLENRAKQDGKPMVLWGWKRDKIVNGIRMPESRTIYFSADLKENQGQVEISRAFFFLETKALASEIEILKSQAPEAEVISDKKDPLYKKLKLIVGNPTQFDLRTVIRRLKGKPRIS